VFAIDGEQWVRSKTAERSELPRDGEDEAVIVHIEERPQLRDITPARRLRQWQQSSRSAKPHWRLLDDAPATGIDLDRAPVLIC
jgi:hypothetical protein